MRTDVVSTILCGLTLVIILFIGLSPRRRRQAQWPVDYLNFIQRSRHPHINVHLILSAPHVMVEGANMSLLSVLRYTPWIRHIHMQMQIETPASLEMDSFLTSFTEPVETYQKRLPKNTTVMILQPGFLLSNYLFPWNVSVRDECGVSARCPLSPCPGLSVCEPDKPPRQQVYWYRAPHPPIVPWVHQVVGYTHTQIQRLFQAEIKHKVKSGVVLIITDQLSDLRHYQGQLWGDHHLVYLFMFSSPQDTHTHVALLHQTIILQNYYLPIYDRKQGLDEARVGLAKMLPLGSSVSRVLWRNKCWDMLGQSLCQEYHAEADTIPPTETESIMREENRRLSTFE